MSERVKQRMAEIDTAANDMQRELEKTHVRSLQRKSFLCGAKCCEDSISTAEDVQRCIQSCQRPLMELQSNVKQELERFQNRIQRCVMTCQDAAQDSLSAVGEERAKQNFDSCLLKCADEHLAVLPSIKQRLLESLSKDL